MAQLALTEEFFTTTTNYLENENKALKINNSEETEQIKRRSKVVAKEWSSVSVQVWLRGGDRGWVAVWGLGRSCPPTAFVCVDLRAKHADNGKDTVCRKGGVKTAC